MFVKYDNDNIIYIKIDNNIEYIAKFENDIEIYKKNGDVFKHYIEDSVYQNLIQKIDNDFINFIKLGNCVLNLNNIIMMNINKSDLFIEMTVKIREQYYDSRERYSDELKMQVDLVKLTNYLDKDVI